MLVLGQCSYAGVLVLILWTGNWGNVEGNPAPDGVRYVQAILKISYKLFFVVT